MRFKEIIKMLQISAFYLDKQNFFVPKKNSDKLSLVFLVIGALYEALCKTLFALIFFDSNHSESKFKHY